MYVVVQNAWSFLNAGTRASVIARFASLASCSRRAGETWFGVVFW
jgi:hypothetical protein